MVTTQIKKKNSRTIQEHFKNKILVFKDKNRKFKSLKLKIKVGQIIHVPETKNMQYKNIHRIKKFKNIQEPRVEKHTFSRTIQEQLKFKNIQEQGQKHSRTFKWQPCLRTYLY